MEQTDLSPINNNMQQKKAGLKQNIRNYLQRINNNKKLVTLMLLALVIIPLLVLALRLFSPENKEKAPSSNTQKTNTIDRKRIARETLAWINQQRDQQGKYYFGISCTNENSCSTIGPDNRIGVFAIWGRYQQYKQSQQQSDLDIINKDLATYTNEQLVNVIQNDYLNCKLMYDVWKDNLFSQEQKVKIKDICTRSQYYLLDDYSTVQATTESNVIPQMERIMAQKKDLLQTAQEDENILELMQLSTSTSDLAVQSKWDNNPTLYKMALMHFQEALDLYQRPSNYESIGYLVGLAAIDLYQQNNNKVFLDFAEHIFSIYSIKPCAALDQCIHALFLTQELQKITEREIYKHYEQNAQGYLLKKRYDQEGLEGYTLGKNSFYQKRADSLLYPVQENALIVGLLLRSHL